LRPLRDEGVLIMASGNVVHNLGLMFGSLRGRPVDDGGASQRFEQYVRDNVATRSYDALVDYEREGPDAAIAVQDIDHYLPLLPVLGTDRGDEPLSFPTAGTPQPGISMLSVRVG
jgi:4,5-DOPA dioxygenase extradiol